MRKVVVVLAVALAHLAAFSALRSLALLKQPELESSAGNWVALEGSALDLQLEGGTLDLQGAPGEPVEFRIESLSLGGFWACPTGLSLTLEDDQSNFRVTMPVVAPRNKDWDRSISGQDQRFSIPVSFRIPSDSALVRRTLDGLITGTVEAPQSIGAAQTVFGERRPAFKDEVVQVRKRIHVSVVPPEQSPRSRVANRARMQLILSAAAFVAFVGCAVYLGFRTKKR